MNEMNIYPGVWLHDHFYRKYCGKPLRGLTDGNWFLLNVREAIACNPLIFSDLEKLGVKCIEFGGRLATAEQMQASLNSRRNIPLILHTEGDPSPEKIASPNDHIALGAFYNILRNIDLCHALNAKKLVLHFPPFNRKMLEICKSIVSYAEARQVILAIENCQYGIAGIDNMLSYREHLPSEFLKFTFDTGHANIGGNPVELLKMVLSDVTHIHWHDNEGRSDRHLGPGMGNINFKELTTSLRRKAKHEITITLECDKPWCVDYEKAFQELKQQVER